MNETMNRLIKIGLILILINIIILLTHYTLPIIFNFLHYLYHLLLPFLAAFFLAFLLHTLVDRLERKGIHRLLAVIFIYLLFFIVIAYLISVIVPLFIAQIESFNDRTPQLYEQIEEWIQMIWIKLPFVPKQYQFSLNDIGSFAERQLLHFDLRKIHIATLFDSFSIIILTPIVTFYFLYDYNNIKKRIRRWLIRRRLRYLYKLMRDLDNGLGSYFRGLVLIMNLMTLAASILFMFTDLEYPILFGFLIGYTNVIPIIGPYIGGIPAVLFALTHSMKTAIIVLVIVVGIQFIESNFVTPYIQSRSIDSHPIMILLAIIVFGKLLGIMGMILAIPLLYVALLITKYVRIHLRLKRAKLKQKKISQIEL